ncbi:MAG: hypothetical protein V3V08_12255 [Nannocystaceae bacterium]
MSPIPPKGYGRNKRIPVAIKLWAAVVLANVGGLFTATIVAAAIRAVPETEAMESTLRAAYYLALLFVAIVDALWLDEVLFRGSFRRTHLSKQQRAPQHLRDNEPDIDGVAATMLRSDISFPFSVVACVCVTYALFNVANHDFEHYYKLVGRHVSALRGSDEARMQKRRAAIVALSIRREHEVLPALFDALQRDDEIAAWSAWAIGRHADIKRRQRMVPPLLDAYGRGGEPLRREAMLALARLQHRPSAAKVQSELARQLDADEEIDTRLVWALGYVQQLGSLPVLERALYHRDPASSRMAAWAIAQHRDQRGGRAGVGLLESRLPAASFDLKCAIVHSLGILADEASNLALIHAYDTLAVEDRTNLCGSISIHTSPDQRIDRQDLLMPRETYAIKTLQSMGQIRATSEQVRVEVDPWLIKMIDDSEATPATREAARSLLQGIREARDDSKPAAAADGSPS